MTDEELTQESIKAGREYVERTQLSLSPMVDVQRAVNYVSHGFYMGWREAEKKLKEKTDEKRE